MIDFDRRGSFVLLLFEGSSAFETSSHLVQSDLKSIL